MNSGQEVRSIEDCANLSEAGSVVPALEKLRLVMTFAEKFCARNKLRPEAFEATVFRLSLKPRARAICWVLGLNPNYFAADREFVRSVGRISRIEDFHSEALDFDDHPGGQGFCHRVLGLRVSKKRLRHLIHETLAHQ